MNPPLAKDLSQYGDAMFNCASSVPRGDGVGIGKTWANTTTSTHNNSPIHHIGTHVPNLSTMTTTKVSPIGYRQPCGPALDHVMNFSSFEASYMELTKKFGNACQRCKFFSRHKKIAYLTQST